MRLTEWMKRFSSNIYSSDEESGNDKEGSDFEDGGTIIT
jgi:hypothetical protein